MSRSLLRTLPFLLTAAFALASAPTFAAPPDRPAQEALVPGAAALEARLLAPCCWVQTLDAHQSELATTLRGAIRRRLLAGESAEAIEDDFAARYGQRIRAVDRGTDLRGVIPIGAAGMSLLFAAIAFVWMRRRTRPAVAQAPALPPAVRDAYDERLDDELRRLDA